MRTGMWAGLPIATNPWNGTDRRTVAAIRERMDGPAEVPDGPPLQGRSLAAFRLSFADGVEEAYAAVYRSDDVALVTVYAVRLDSEPDSAGAAVTPRKSARTRFVSGRTIVEVSGERSACFPGVAAHVKTLLNR